MGILLQVISVEPAFHSRASFVGHDQTYRYVESLVDYLRKEVSCSRSLAHSLRTYHFPLAVGIIEWLHAHHAWNLHIVNTPVVVGVNHHLVVVFYRAVAESLDGHFHITLTGANPHLARKNAVKFCLLSIIEGN